MRLVRTMDTNAHRDIEEEDPAPRVVVGDPAADGRPDGGRHHHGHAINSESDTALFRREGIGQDCALAGLQAPAGRALNDAEEDQQGSEFARPQQKEKMVKARRSSCRSACGRCGWRSSR